MSNEKEKLNLNLENEINKLTSKIYSFNKKSKTFSLLRLSVFIFGLFIFLGFYFYNIKSIAYPATAIASIIFIFLMIVHNKIEAAITIFNIYLQIKKDELARSKLDWENIPELENALSKKSSYLEQDLNIIETNGLLQLINTGVSLECVNILRDWLSGKIIDNESILHRQKIIGELITLKRFRDRLLLKSKLSIKKRILKVEISEWIKTTKAKQGLLAYTLFLSLLSFLNILAATGFIFGIFDSYYYQILMVYLFFYFAGTKYIGDIKNVSEILYEELRKFSSIFKFIENYNFKSNDSLKNLLQPFLSIESPPSKLLSKINITIEILIMQKNPVVWIFLFCIAPINYLLSIKVENFRKSIAEDFPKWLDAWYNLEAYCSFADFAHLNPDYRFAEIRESNNLLEAKNLGHPLIKPDCRIANDFIINESMKTNIITGSNMSGKSTFLRTIGVNILLASAGSVVNAERFVLSKFNIYSCIKVSDSVVDGMSYFYSEVKRLKAIIDDIKTKNEKSLVLIDEIYKGTNNVERIGGSTALIKYLSEENIYSVISTHDLELVKIADEIKNVKNYHFKELIQENKMSFDFKLMEGPCPTTNALKIMKLEGLPT